MAKIHPKRWKRRKSKQANSIKGSNNPNFKPEHRIRAKAIYLESSGKIFLKDIAKQVGVSAQTVSEWRKAGDWDLEIKGVQKAIQNTVNGKLLAASKVKSLLSDVSEEQLISAVDMLVGKSVTNSVSIFLAKVHKQDMKDLDALNRAIRMHLRDGVIDDLKPTDIVNLTNAKTNIIKNVRLIFGQPTEYVDGGEDKNEINIYLDKQQSDSLKIVEQMSEQEI